MSHPFDNYTPQQIADYYYRMAKIVEVEFQNKGLANPLSSHFLKNWLDNRNSATILRFDPPDYLKNHEEVIKQLQYQRQVFLTQKKGRTSAGERWLGIKPRLQGKIWEEKDCSRWSIPAWLNVPCLTNWVPLIKKTFGIHYMGSNCIRQCVFP
ncbi:MAG: hypothetical protein LBU43_05820 [Candidatus Accumulibacter sp.]|jgi:hypothetical protein|nr:hypothetical protein [Accumulibacter sp.]